MSEIFVHGISGSELPPVCDRQLASCSVVVVSKRFTSLLPAESPPMTAITPVQEMLVAVADALQAGNVMVLASGDPLFYGIGRALLDRFGPEKVNFHPALSAVQLACARFKLPWDDLGLVSLHGREPGSLAGRILPYGRVMLFTDHRNSPDRIAAILLQTLRKYGDEKRLKKIRVRVAENLGTRDEKLTTGSLSEIAETHFEPLNMMLVEQDLPVMNLPVFGLRESEITHSRGLITKDEIRAVILHCLRLPEHGVFWDVGGGSGSISVEAARLAPGLSEYVIEKKQEGRDNIRRNIVRYNLYSIQLIAGEAPDALTALPDPDRIFIGGSGGRLDDIICHCADRLKTGGILVVSAVLKTTADQAPELMLENGLEVGVRIVQVDRKRYPGGKAQQLNSITIITGKK